MDDKLQKLLHRKKKDIKNNSYKLLKYDLHVLFKYL